MILAILQGITDDSVGPSDFLSFIVCDSCLECEFFTILYVGFHVAVALSIVVFTLHVFLPGTITAGLNAVHDFIHPMTARLLHFNLEMIIETTSAIATKTFSTSCQVTRYLGSKGAAAIDNFQTFSG